MASPQPTPFIRFSKELFEAFYQDPPDTVVACRIWLWVMRYTYGNFGKDETPGKSIREIAEEIGTSKTAAHRAIQGLIRCKRLKLGSQGGFSIQKDYDKWTTDDADKARSGQIRMGIVVQKKKAKRADKHPVLWEETVPTLGTNCPHPGDKDVPPLGTPIRSKNTIEIESTETGAAVEDKGKPNGVQIVMRAFKIAKSIKEDDATWDKRNFKRFARSAADVLMNFHGDAEAAAAYVIAQGKYLDGRNLPGWGLEAIARAAALSPMPTGGATGKVCPLCDANPLPYANAIVCEKCGARCRKCNNSTANLKIIVRPDKTKTAVCANGCGASPSPIARAALPQATKDMDAARRDMKFLSEHNRRKDAKEKS